MLDIKLIREDPDAIRRNLERRQNPENLEILNTLLEEDKKWREATIQVNQLRRRRNEISSQIGKIMKEGRDVSSLREEGLGILQLIADAEKTLEYHRENMLRAQMRLPNILHESVPYGTNDYDNIEIRRWGAPPEFNFKSRSHVDIVTDLGILDMERAAKVSGAGFYYMKSELVLLEMAIMQYAVENLVMKGYTLIRPPYMIRRKPYEGVTDLTDFEEVMYKIEDEDLYLIATSEHALGAMLMNETLLAENLPIKLCGISPCFRKEIGTHGKYTKGLFRVHQFNKIEQFVFCLPENSWALHEEIQKNSEELYQGLGLHYRVVNVCTGDIGSIAAKKYDTEVWMSDNEFREVGSNSNCTDYQARRLNVKYRMKEGQGPVGPVHTLNNTALATSRTLIAVIEQYQQEDGNIKIPKALKKYMNKMEIITGLLNPLKI